MSDDISFGLESSKPAWEIFPSDAQVVSDRFR
jgi:hypothetical protein